MSPEDQSRALSAMSPEERAKALASLSTTEGTVATISTTNASLGSLDKQLIESQDEIHMLTEALKMAQAAAEKQARERELLEVLKNSEIERLEEALASISLSNEQLQREQDLQYGLSPGGSARGIGDSHRGIGDSARGIGDSHRGIGDSRGLQEDLEAVLSALKSEMDANRRTANSQQFDQMVELDRRSNELSQLAIERGVKVKILERKVNYLESQLEQAQESLGSTIYNDIHGTPQSHEAQMMIAMRLENERLVMRVMQLENAMSTRSASPIGQRNTRRQPTSHPTVQTERARNDARMNNTKEQKMRIAFTSGRVELNPQVLPGVFHDTCNTHNTLSRRRPPIILDFEDDSA